MKNKLGFTMIELIIVISLLGIMAIIAIPRLANTTQFNDRGNSDKVEFLLKSAQKIASSQRRNIYVIKDGTILNLCYQNTTPCLVAQSVTINNNILSIDIGSTSITLPSPLFFNSLGNTGGSMVTIPVGSKTIYIEQESGYVHQ